LVLSGRADCSTNVLGSILAVPAPCGDYIAETVLNLADAKPGVTAGIAAIGDPANSMGLAVGDGKLLLWRRDKDVQRELATVTAPKASKIHLKASVKDGKTFDFAFSSDGHAWQPVGSSLSGEQLPPWDRSIRVGITVGGVNNAMAHFDSFKLHPTSPTK
jgi:hypothetical protein